MNFLAHCLLARPGAGFIAGGVLGDFVKGRISDALPPELGAGIRLHRRIDSHSNRLPEMKASIRLFDPSLRRAAPVLLDIVADHCLALSWERFADEELGAFTADVYAAIDTFGAWVPERGRRFVAHMAATDLLARYEDGEVVRRAMGHVLERLRLAHLDDRLDDVLAEKLAGFMDDFAHYFPLLQAFADAERHRVAPPDWRSARY